MIRAAPALLAAALLIAACGGDGANGGSPAAPDTPAEQEDVMPLSLESDAFKDGETIPTRYTCDGEDVSPALSWASAPARTEAFALIMDDPDAPGGTFTHWVLYNVPPDVFRLAEGIQAADAPDVGGASALQGLNDFGNVGYGGPCPPAGPAHRYNFTLYALDGTVDLDPGATKERLLQAVEGRILDQATLTGTYGR